MAARHGKHIAGFRHKFCLPCNVLQRVGGDNVVAHGHRHAVVVCLYQLGGIGAKLCGQHAVVGRGAAAALHMAGHAHACFKAGHLLYLARNAAGGRALAALGAPGRALFLLHGSFGHVVSALGHGNDGEGFALLAAALDGVHHVFDVIGQLGNAG